MNTRTAEKTDWEVVRENYGSPTHAGHIPCVCLCVCVCACARMYCNRPLDTEFPASVTTKAAGGLHCPFSGMVQGNVKTSLAIPTLSQSNNKHLLSRTTAPRFTANLRQFIHNVS